MHQVSRKRTEVLGVKIDNVSYKESLHKIKDLVEKGRFGTPGYLVKPNAEIISYAQNDKEFKAILNSAGLATADGIGLLLAFRIIGNRLKERVGGPELMESILEVAAQNGYSVFFLGSRPHVVEKLVKVVKSRFPKLKISGFHHGYFEKDTRIIERITKSKPDILFVALGFPKQEKWISGNLKKIQVPLSVAEGGSFDFISGEVRRAPKWMRSMGLEWLFRLIVQPSRIKRQLALPKFLFLVLLNR